MLVLSLIIWLVPGQVREKGKLGLWWESLQPSGGYMFCLDYVASLQDQENIVSGIDQK